MKRTIIKFTKIFSVTVLILSFVLLTILLFSFKSFPEYASISRWIIGTTLLTIVPIFTALTFFTLKQDSKLRIEDMKLLADKWKFQYSATSTRPVLIDNFLNEIRAEKKDVNILNGSPLSILSGKFKDKEAIIIDQFFSYKGGKNRRNLTQTIIFLKTNKQLPTFVCEPNIPMLQKFSNHLAQNQIQVTNDAEFNGKYNVCGKQIELVRQVFNQNVIALIKKKQQVRIVGVGNYLMIQDDWNLKSILKENEIVENLELLNKFAEFSKL